MINRNKIQAKALKALITSGGNTLVLSPGVGKSKVAIDYIKHAKAKNILITSPRTNLKDSWKKELEKWNIERYSVENPSSYYYNKTKCFIEIINIQTCYKWNKEIIKDYDLIICDEVHTMVSEEYGKLLINAKKLNITVIGLTGTPDDKKVDKKLFYFKYCPIVYRYLDAAKDGIINKRKYIIYEHTLNNDYQIEVKTKTKSWFTGEKKQYSYINSQIEKGKSAIRKILEIPNNTDEYINYFGYAQKWYFDKNFKNIDKKKAGGLYMRNITARQNLLWKLNSTKTLSNMISHIILNKNKNNKLLIFSSRTEQADKISKYCIHSKNKEFTNKQYLTDFNLGKIRQLGSCYSLTLGLNLDNAKYAIMESYNGSDVQFKQRGGRLDRLNVDENAIVIFIVVKNTQGEVWYNKSVQFEEHDIVNTVNNMKDLKQILDNYE